MLIPPAGNESHSRAELLHSGKCSAVGQLVVSVHSRFHQSPKIKKTHHGREYALPYNNIVYISAQYGVSARLF
jgi:hypothetical protein